MTARVLRVSFRSLQNALSVTRIRRTGITVSHAYTTETPFSYGDNSRRKRRCVTLGDYTSDEREQDDCSDDEV